MPKSPERELPEARLKALRRYRSQEPESMPDLDRLTELAATLFDAPISLVTLAGAEEQWVVSSFGTEQCATSLEDSFCRHTIASSGPTVVEDLSVDERFAENRFVNGEPGLRFYVGAPLCTSDGHRIGTMCVLDRDPRSPSDQTVRQLGHLAEMAMEVLERHQFTVDDRPELSQTILDHLPGIFYVFGPDARLWRWNSQFEDRYGYDEETLRGRSGTSFFEGDDRARVGGKIAEVFESGSAMVEADFITNDGDRVPMLFTGVRVQLAGEPHLVGMGVDISERKQAEEALRRSQKKYKSLFEGANDAILVHDLSGQIVEVNSKAESLFACSKDDLVGARLHELHPEATDTVPDEALRVLRRGEDYGVVTEYLRRDGSSFWGHFTATPIRIGGDAVIRSMIRDVTDTRQMQRELQRRKQVLQTVFENMPVMIAFFDEEGAFQLVNREVEKTLGWSKEEVPEHPDPLVELLHSSERAKEVLQFIRDAPDEWREYRVQTKDGDTLPVRATSVKLEDGRRLGIGIDLSEEKRRQKRLRLLEAALENSRVPVVIMEATPGTPIEYTNPVFTDVTGYEPDEIRGRSFDVLQGPETESETVERLQAVLEKGEPVREVIRSYRKDGTPFWNDVYMAPVPNSEGDVTHYVSIQADVTERVQQREALRQAKEKAEEANRIKAALLSNMNHEFRTPLTSIISFSDLISKSPDLADDFADRILGGGTRLLRTLNTVMDFAELEGDQIRPTPEVFDVREVAWTVAGDFRSDAERKGLDLRVEVPDEPVMVVLDRHHVERICTHLVSNAVKFTEEGTVTVQVRDGEDVATLVVEDSGIGIEPAFRPDMFDEFAQASSGYDRTHEGNGLGLTIVKRLVNRMEGEISIDSEPDVGTRVAVQLPEDARP